MTHPTPAAQPPEPDAHDREPADPMDWPLPCDVTVGHGTMRKGVRLRTLVARMKVLYEMATGENADEVAGRTIQQRQAMAAQMFNGLTDDETAQTASVAGLTPLTPQEVRAISSYVNAAAQPPARAEGE